MTSSKDSYKRIKADLQEYLATRGFRRDRGNWRRRLDETDQFIGLQRNVDSSPTGLKVTVNIGVNSALIDKIRGRQNLPSEVADCHSHGRISNFMTAFKTRGGGSKATETTRQSSENWSTSWDHRSFRRWTDCQAAQNC